ncbi:hypothetical protein GW17_00061819 [Ensete ventricosum]|nr:hypothetical protein GW17_00061819 [Ensete ventricosum]RZS28679.1 hypothetical protein BHM03_00062314 [Ensete ventricosum]
MHPLRFPNSGIRAKVFVRKIGFKLRVMRLNHVELFYVLVAAIGSESRRCLWGRGDHMHVVCMQRWLVMAWLPTKGGRLRPGPLQGAATRGHSWLQPALSPAGAAVSVVRVAAP